VVRVVSVVQEVQEVQEDLSVLDMAVGEQQMAVHSVAADGVHLAMAAGRRVHGRVGGAVTSVLHRLGQAGRAVLGVQTALGQLGLAAQLAQLPRAPIRLPSADRRLCRRASGTKLLRQCRRPRLPPQAQVPAQLFQAIKSLQESLVQRRLLS